MSAQRRSSASNRRARGRNASASRQQASTATLEPSMAASRTPTMSTDVAEPAPARRDETRAASRPSGERSRGQRTDAAVSPFRARLEGIERYLRETRAELRRVTWPDTETTRNLTVVVIGVSVVMGLLLGGVDFVLYKLFEAL